MGNQLCWHSGKSAPARMTDSCSLHAWSPSVGKIIPGWTRNKDEASFQTEKQVFHAMSSLRALELGARPLSLL